MVYFSQLQGRPVYDSNGKNIGILRDLIFIDGEKFAEISHLIYCAKDNWRRKIPWKFVKELSDKNDNKKMDIDIHLNTPENELEPTFEREKELLVSKIVDKQIIDVDGVKVVRVNDVLLGKIEETFSIAAVCVGAKSFMRSLAGERIGEAMSSGVKENIIPWEFVEPLDPEIQKLHIKLKRSKIEKLHPADIADLMEDLTYQERELIFNNLDKDKAAQTIIESEPEFQKSFLKTMKLNSIVEILENIPLNHAADILSIIPDYMKNDIVNNLSKETAKKIKEIMKYPEASVGSIMHTDFFSIPNSYTAEETINLLRKIKPASELMYRIYITDADQKLVGFLPLRTLVTAPANEKVENLMKTKIIKLTVFTSKQDAAIALAKYNIFVLPVVDENNVLKGVLKADDVISEVIPRSWKVRHYVAPRTRKPHSHRNEKLSENEAKNEAKTQQK
jgi:sporulation protein YlmC with PRC-barrel domain/CBS domain-containing protein